MNNQTMFSCVCLIETRKWCIYLVSSLHLH